MKKKLFLLFLFPLLVFASANNNEQYFVYNNNTPTQQDFQNIITSRITDQNYLDFNLNGKHLCGEIYTIKDGKKVPVPLSSEFLLNFDFEKGKYSCSYTVKETGKVYVSNYTVKDWELLVGKYATNIRQAPSLFNGEFFPDNGDRLSSTDFRKNISDFSIINKAKDLGIISLNGTYPNGNNIMLSKFVNNLITLNGDYVQGVDSKGEIIVNPEIENKFLSINNKGEQNGFFSTLWQGIKDVVTTGASSERKNFMMEQFQSLSQIQYFDKKLFGLYYNFMSIAWGNIFNYAGTLFLAFLALYLSGNVALKYALHKLKHEDEQGAFEFPIKTRLVSIAMTLMVSFIQFPTGEGSQISNETIQAQTSIAKKIISYLGSMGSSVADYSAGAIETIYMQYLLNANRSYGIHHVYSFEKEQEENVMKQKLRVVFFHTACQAEYPVSYKKYGDFSGVADKLESPEWTSEVTDDWYERYGSSFFGENGKKNNARVALSLCAKTQKDIVFNNSKLEHDKKIIEDAIKNIDSYKQSGRANIGKVFALSQLVAVKNMGWYAIASIPVLQVYLKNTDLINTISKMKSSGDGYSSLTEKNLHDMDTELQKDGNNYNMERYTRGMEKETMGSSNMLREMFKYQVYFMMPGFESLYNFSKVFAKGAILGVGEVAKMIPMMKEGGVLFKLFNKAKNNAAVGKANSLMFGVFVSVMAFILAIFLYDLIIKIIFAGVVALLITVKIVFYIIDVFIYYFVSPFVVGWQMTIQSNTDKLHKYISNGFVLLVVKPSLIVFSTMMFVVGMGLMHSIYNMIFDIVYSSIELANSLLGKGDFSVTGFLIMANIKGISEIFIDLVGLVLAYKLIMEGDKMILDKFGYRDENENSISTQVSDKIQTLAGKI